MYFVPLISPEPVSSSTSPGSTQTARVLSARRKGTAHSFVVTCEFEFTGNGSQQSILDLAPTIRRHDRELRAGGSTGRQLSSINVNGSGSGTVEVEGTVSNNVETVREVRLRFNAHHKTSPVSIALCEIRYHEGEFRRLNEIIARVNTLTFRRGAGPPKMEVTVASVKNKAAGDGLWTNLKASVKYDNYCGPNENKDAVVTSQNPHGGSSAHDGDTVTITIPKYTGVCASSKTTNDQATT